MDKQLKVGLFVTCLVDAIRPSIGFAALQLLQQAGCEVIVPERQTCCGQPAYNMGDENDTKKLATNVIELFADCDYVVVPSGSCASMIRVHYPKLFAEDTAMILKANQLATRTYELTTFLVDVLAIDDLNIEYKTSLSYHDSCAGLRELDIKQQPRKLLQQLKGCQLKTLKDAEVCCGFGGTFCVKYADISDEMLNKKINCIKASNAKVLAAGDLGCLMNIAGKLSRENIDVKCFHVAEILAGMADTIAPIGSQ